MAPSPRNGSRPATLADVASAAGVSRATASRALGGAANVSEAARERVWAAARVLDFQPNQLARSLRRGSTMTIGLVVPDLTSAFYVAALDGAQDVLEHRGYHALVVNTVRAARRERAAMDILRAHRVDGVIVASYGGYEDIGVPATFFDDVPQAAGAGAVALENERGVAMLVEHLAGVHAHRRIAFVGTETGGMAGTGTAVFTGRERLEGFRAAMGRAGLPLPPELVRTCDPLAPGAIEDAVGAVLAQDPPPTAVVAATDTIAIGVLRAARERGLRVPEDLALVSFDEPPWADVLDPPVTSLDPHGRELGERAARMLLAALGRDTATAPAPELVRVPLRMRVRRSCGCDGRARAANARAVDPAVSPVL